MRRLARCIEGLAAVAGHARSVSAREGRSDTNNLRPSERKKQKRQQKTSSPEPRPESNSRSPGFKTIKSDLLEARQAEDFNKAAELLQHWLEHYREEGILSLTPREYKNFLHPIVREGAKCQSPENITLQTNLTLANVALSANLSTYAMVYLDRIAEQKGQPPDPTSVAMTFLPQTYEKALQWVQKNNYQVNALLAIRRMGELGGWNTALQLAYAVERGIARASGECYSASVLIPYLASGGNWTSAMQLFQQVVLSGRFMSDRIVREVLEASVLGMEKQLPSSSGGEASEKRMKGPGGSNPSLSSWESSLKLLAAMDTVMMLGPASDARLFHKLIQRVPSWEAAIQVFNAAQRNCIFVDKMLATATLNHCERAGRWDIALEMCEKMKKEGTLSKNLTQAGYEALVSAYNRSVEWKEAIAALRWMGHASVASEEVGQASMLHLYDQAGDWESALELGAKMLQKKQEYERKDYIARREDIDPPVTSGHIPKSAYLAMFRACAKGGRWETALDLLSSTVLGAGERIQGSSSPLILGDTSRTMLKIGGAATVSTMEACLAAGHYDEAVRVHEASKVLEPKLLLPSDSYMLAVKAHIAQSKTLVGPVTSTKKIISTGHAEDALRNAQNILGEMRSKGLRHSGAVFKDLEEAIEARTKQQQDSQSQRMISNSPPDPNLSQKVAKVIREAAKLRPPRGLDPTTSKTELQPHQSLMK